MSSDCSSADGSCVYALCYRVSVFMICISVFLCPRTCRILPIRDLLIRVRVPICTTHIHLSSPFRPSVHAVRFIRSVLWFDRPSVRPLESVPFVPFGFFLFFLSIRSAYSIRSVHSVSANFSERSIPIPPYLHCPPIACVSSILSVSSVPYAYPFHTLHLTIYPVRPVVHFNRSVDSV